MLKCLVNLTKEILIHFIGRCLLLQMHVMKGTLELGFVSFTYSVFQEMNKKRLYKFCVFAFYITIETLVILLKEAQASDGENQNGKSLGLSSANTQVRVLRVATSYKMY